MNKPRNPDASRQMLPDALPAEWLRQAEYLAPYAPAAAEAFRQAAHDLTDALELQGDIPLTPAELEAMGRCSAETVRRAVRSGSIENVGTPGKIKVRAGDTAKLPKARGRPSKRTSYGKIARRIARASKRAE